MIEDYNGNIKIEAFLAKLHFAGKTGVTLPIPEKRANERIEFLMEWLKKGLISGEFYDRETKLIRSLSLNEEMYQEFCDLASMIRRNGFMQE